MTVEHYDPEKANVGYHNGDPLGDVEEYSEYPNNREECLSWNAKPIVTSVLDAVGGDIGFAADEMDLPKSNLAGFCNKFDIDHGPEVYPDFFVTIPSATVSVHNFRTGRDEQAEADTVYRHCWKFDENDPLRDDEFLPMAHGRGNGAQAIADMLGNVSSAEVKDALVHQGLVERDYVDIGDERYQLEDYHEKPYCDGRLLEAADEAGWTIEDLARRFNTTINAARKQVIRHNLDA